MIRPFLCGSKTNGVNRLERAYAAYAAANFFGGKRP
jgi:hypothetical protein